MTQSAPAGILLVDKDPGITSHDVVARVRRAFGTRKVGHAGTLDPMATGLLVVGVGPATKLLTYLVGLDKEYTATIRLGQSTTTEDADGELVATAPAAAIARIDEARLAEAVAGLTGVIAQRPSSVSAIRVDGRRAYERVRSGEDVELPARAVTVSAFEVLAVRRASAPADAASRSQEVSGPEPQHAVNAPSSGEKPCEPEGADPRGAAVVLDVDVRVACSSGTYVRALARDLGDRLGVGGHLTALRRERIGPFRVSDAVPVVSRERDAPTDPVLAARLLAPAAVAGALFPIVALGAAAARDLADGKRIPVGAPDGGPVAAVAEDGRLIGLVEVAGGRARVLMNLPVDPGGRARAGQDGDS